MRLLKVLFLLFPFACQAEETGSTVLYEACKNIENDVGIVAQHPYCSGFIRGIVPTIYRLHAFYEASFPNLTYPIKDQATLGRFSATGILLGYNICLPDKIEVHTVASILRKYGREHPEKLSSSEYAFVSEALFFAFPCNRR